MCFVRDSLCGVVCCVCLKKGFVFVCGSCKRDCVCRL